MLLLYPPQSPFNVFFIKEKIILEVPFRDFSFIFHWPQWLTWPFLVKERILNGYIIFPNKIMIM
jgi:hypothetical protein